MAPNGAVPMEKPQVLEWHWALQRNVPSVLGSTSSFLWYSRCVGAGDQRKAPKPERPAITDTFCTGLFT